MKPVTRNLAALATKYEIIQYTVKELVNKHNRRTTKKIKQLLWRPARDSFLFQRRVRASTVIDDSFVFDYCPE